MFPPSYSWKLMVEAAYRKYPNPYSSHIHSLDTLQRRVTGRKIYSHRLFCTMWSIPSLVIKVSGLVMTDQTILADHMIIDWRYSCAVDCRFQPTTTPSKGAICM